MGYLDGVTSNIQTQLDGKATTSNFSTQNSSLQNIQTSFFDYDINYLCKSNKEVQLCFNIKPVRNIGQADTQISYGIGRVPEGYRPTQTVSIQSCTGRGTTVYFELGSDGNVTIYTWGIVIQGDTICFNTSWLTN